MTGSARGSFLLSLLYRLSFPASRYLLAKEVKGKKERKGRRGESPLFLRPERIYALFRGVLGDRAGALAGGDGAPVCSKSPPAATMSWAA
jgi:hypothetical protein